MTTRVLSMTEPIAIEVNSEQRDLLLKGLRYVRSHIMLTTGDPTEQFVSQRQSDLQQVADLAAILKGDGVAQQATV